MELLEGASLNVELPLSEDLINQVINDTVVDREEIRAMHVSFEPGNKALVRMKVKMPALLFKVNLPEKTLHLDIEPPRGLPDKPVIPLRITGGLNPLEKGMLQIFDSVLSKRFPKGVKLDDNIITIDLRAMLAQKNMEHLVDYLRDLWLETRRDKLIVKAHIEVAASNSSKPEKKDTIND